MVSKKQKEQAQARNQIWLSFLFMIMILGNFVSVAGITYYYETNGHENVVQLFTTDSNTDFSNIPFGVTMPTNNLDNFTTGHFFLHATTVTWLSYDKTPAYLGNDTWGFSVNATFHAGASTREIITIDLPELDQWIITDVDINTTLPGNTDQQLDLRLYSKNTPIEVTDPFLDVEILSLATTPLSTSIDKHIDVNPVSSLGIYQNSQGKAETGLQIIILDSANDGQNAFACQFSVTIFGTQATGWTLETSLLISTIIWNIIILIGVVYSLDMFDIGGFVKTLKKGRS